MKRIIIKQSYKIYQICNKEESKNFIKANNYFPVKNKKNSQIKNVHFTLKIIFKFSLHSVVVYESDFS